MEAKVNDRKVLNTLSRPGVDVIKLFWMKSRKSRFLPKLKQQEYAILKAINSLRVSFSLKISLFSHFSAGSDFSSKNRFYNINYWTGISPSLLYFE